jgi:hypothetical protein
MPVESATRTPSIDFAAALAPELHSIGATDRECEAYLAGVRRGNVLVFVTRSLAQAEAATTVRNSYEPIELDGFLAAVPAAVGVHGKEIEAHDSISLDSDQARAKTEGARVFSW